MAELLAKCLEIQNQLQKSLKKGNSKTIPQKVFTNMMMKGKVKKALRQVKSKNDIDGFHDLTPNILGMLKSKHPPLQNFTKMQ